MKNQNEVKWKFGNLFLLALFFLVPIGMAHFFQSIEDKGNLPLIPWQSVTAGLSMVVLVLSSSYLMPIAGRSGLRQDHPYLVAGGSFVLAIGTIVAILISQQTPVFQDLARANYVLGWYTVFVVGYVAYLVSYGSWFTVAERSIVIYGNMVMYPGEQVKLCPSIFDYKFQSFSDGELIGEVKEVFQFGGELCNVSAPILFRFDEETSQTRTYGISGQGFYDRVCRVQEYITILLGRMRNLSSQEVQHELGLIGEVNVEGQPIGVYLTPMILPVSIQTQFNAPERPIFLAA